MSVLFVTGTDTEVGKTVATAALVAGLLRDGHSPYVLKPAQTGVGPGEPGDLDEVRRLVGYVPGHEGIRLREPLAPLSAARREGATLPSLVEQRDTIVRLDRHHDVVVEGAGGILVRLGDSWSLLDLADAVAHAGVPVETVVVARAGLGTLNHAALTVDALTRRGLRVRGVVVGAWPEHPDLAAEENVHDLPAYTGVPLLGRIPAGAGKLTSTAFSTAAPGWLDAPPIS